MASSGGKKYHSHSFTVARSDLHALIMRCCRRAMGNFSLIVARRMISGSTFRDANEYTKGVIGPVFKTDITVRDRVLSPGRISVRTGARVSLDRLRVFWEFSEQSRARMWTPDEVRISGN